MLSGNIYTFAVKLYIMIQRIQSVYLLLATGAFGGQFVLPYLFTETNNPATTVPALADGALTPLDNIGLLGLTALAVLLPLIAIFLFKNRALQGKITGLGILVGILLLTLAAITAQATRAAIPSGGSVQFGPGWLAPVAGLLLLWLAGRSIRKDENLVRSMDRLR